MSQAQSDFLSKMRALKQAEVQALRGTPEARRAAVAAPRHAPGALLRALSRPAELSVIAEIKRASPSAGSIRAEVDPVGRARLYQEAGAAAISVLTESEYFGGSLLDLRQVAQAVDIPVLRKDFILDEVQIDAAVEAGAAAVLLIVAFVSAQALPRLMAHAQARGLDVLVEVHDPQEIPAALDAGAQLLGVNARDLRSLQVNTEHTWAMGVQLAALDSPPPVRVAESGIKTAQDAARAVASGFGACLVGEALMRQDDPRALVQRLRFAGGLA